MGYYIEQNEKLSEGLSRIGLEQNNKAIDALANDDESLHKGVHKARKHFKKLRAIYRLVRDELGDDAYKEGNVFYRDLGRELESLRDITSRMETVELLRSHFGSTVKDEAFEDVLRLLQVEREALREEEYEGKNRIEAVINELQQARERFMGFPVGDDDLKNLIKSMRRVYKRGYKAYGNSFGNPSLEQMHEWRKRVKYLWYHHRLIKMMWPEVFKGYTKSIKSLSDYLGDYHDLALFQRKIEEYSGKLSDESRRVLKALSRELMAQLADDARELGSRLYAEKPDAFAARMEKILGNTLFSSALSL